MVKRNTANFNLTFSKIKHIISIYIIDIIHVYNI